MGGDTNSGAPPSGAALIRAQEEAKGRTVSKLGAKVADILTMAYGGMFILTYIAGEVDWANHQHIRVTLPVHPGPGGLPAPATWDATNLTWLVLGAHISCVRLEIEPGGPDALILDFEARWRTGYIAERHPTIVEAVELFLQRGAWLQECTPERETLRWEE